MAKTRYITRTIHSTRITAYYFNEETNEVDSYVTDIPGSHTSETALAYLRYCAKHNRDEFGDINFVKAGVIKVLVSKRRMSEETFLEHSEECPENYTEETLVG